MKGVANIEFILSVFIFIVVISFVTLTIAGVIPIYHNSIVKDSSSSSAFQISERVIEELSIPSSSSSFQKYELQNGQVTSFFQQCKTPIKYAETRDKFTEDYNDINITIMILSDDGERTIERECAPIGRSESLVARESVIDRVVFEGGEAKILRITFIPGR